MLPIKVCKWEWKKSMYWNLLPGNILTGKDSWFPIEGRTGMFGKCFFRAAATIWMTRRLESRDWIQMSWAGRSPEIRIFTNLTSSGLIYFLFIWQPGISYLLMSYSQYIKTHLIITQYKKRRQIERSSSFMYFYVRVYLLTLHSLGQDECLLCLPESLPMSRVEDHKHILPNTSQVWSDERLASSLCNIKDICMNLVTLHCSSVGHEGRISEELWFFGSLSPKAE